MQINEDMMMQQQYHNEMKAVIRFTRFPQHLDLEQASISSSSEDILTERLAV